MILDPAYIQLWFQIAFPFILILAVVLVPLFGIWYELRKRRKNDEKLYSSPPSDEKAKGHWLPPMKDRIDYNDTSKYYDDDDGPYDQLEERIK